MKRKISIAIITLFTLVISGNAQKNNFAVSQSEKDNLSDIQWIEKATELTVEDNDIPAVAVGLIKNGKVIKFINKGVMNRKTNKSIDENTIFQIGSLTKMFTGIVANNLINEGTLNTDASIVEYLPESLSAKAKFKLRPISVRDLLHHRSGIPNNSKVYYRFGNDPMVCCYTESDLLNDLEILKLDFKPDEKTSYSNMGFAVAGYVLERASGKSYEELIQTHISSKYGLKNTTTILSDEQKKFLATPYRKENRKYATKPFEMGKMVSGGGIYSTLTDLSKLMLNQISAYRNPSAVSGKNPLFLTRSTKPFSPNVSYGYGLFSSSNGLYGHSGDLDGFGSNYAFYSKKNIGVVVLASSGGAIWMPGFEALVREKLLGQTVELPKVRKAISIPRKKLAKYTGKYLVAGSQIVNVVQNESSLEAYLQGSFGPIELFFESERKLFSRTFDAYFEFDFDGKQSVSNVTYTFGGQKLPVKRLQ